MGDDQPTARVYQRKVTGGFPEDGDSPGDNRIAVTLTFDAQGLGYYIGTDGHLHYKWGPDVNGYTEQTEYYLRACYTTCSWEQLT